MSTNRRAGISLGVATILVTFVLLCMTTFATMALISADRDYTLTQKQAQATRDYYAADCAAEERLGELHAAVGRCLSAGATADAFWARLGDTPGLWDTWERETPATALLGYAVDMGGGRKLEVTWALRYLPESHTASLTTRSYVVTAEAGESGGFLELWPGPGVEADAGE